MYAWSEQGAPVLGKITIAVLLLLAGSTAAQQKPDADPYAQHLRDGNALAIAGNLGSAMAQVQAAVALQPGNAAGWYQLGSLLGQTGDFPGARKAFHQALSLQPEMAKAHYALALTLVGNPQDTEDWAGAVAECQEALKRQPAYPEALNLMGVGLSKQAQYADAIAAFEQAVQLNPSFPEAHFNLGLALEAKDRLDDAAQQYQAAISGKGKYPEASSALSKLLLRMGKPAEAEKAVNTALQANPDLTDAHYTRARILQALQRKQEAAVEFAIAKELTERPANGIQSSQLSNQALAAASQGDFAGATATLGRAIALKPDYGVPHFNLGLIFADQSKTKAAIDELSKATSLLPGQAAPWFELGRTFALAKDDEKAQQAIAWAAYLAPGNAKIQAELTRMQAAGAASPPVTQPAIGAAADTATAHADFAKLLLRQGDTEGAIGEWLRTLSLQPDAQQARRDLAAAYELNGERDRAVLEYRKLLVAFPRDSAASIALGRILLKQGNALEAKQQFKQALVNDPGSAQAQTLLKAAEARK